MREWQGGLMVLFAQLGGQRVERHAQEHSCLSLIIPGAGLKGENRHTDRQSERR